MGIAIAIVPITNKIEPIIINKTLFIFIKPPYVAPKGLDYNVSDGAVKTLAANSLSNR